MACSELGFSLRPVFLWHPASVNASHDRYFDRAQNRIAYRKEELRITTSTRHQQLLQLIQMTGAKTFDHDNEPQERTLSALSERWRLAGPVVAVWDAFNRKESHTLDGASRALPRLVSVTFDGTTPGQSFCDVFFDLSHWDGTPQSALGMSLLQTLKQSLDVSDVFVSYARKDQPLAQQLCAELTSRNWSVWWDPALVAGDTFARVIYAKLANVKGVVVLWTKESVASPWVRREATRGRKRGVLIPVAVGVEPPKGFERLQTLPLRQNDPASLRDTASAISEFLRTHTAPSLQ
jgi:TIR domain-containing protein